MKADLGEGTFELVRGEVIEVPPSMPEHGRVCVNVGFTLESYGRQSGYGYALSNDSAVVTERGPDTVRGADVCFYSHDALAPVGGRDEASSRPSGPGRRGLFPEQSPRRDPREARGIPSCRDFPRLDRLSQESHGRDSSLPDEPPEVLKEDAVIENLPELPGFRCAVADFFL